MEAVVHRISANVFRTIKINSVSVIGSYQNWDIHKRLTHTGPFIELPKIGHGKSFRRIVHYPEKYTVEPLRVTNLAGRDPVTGRVVVKGIGGGIKHKYHWIEWARHGPNHDPPLEEKVIQILKCGCRTAPVALVATKDKMKYILATVNMKAGDIIKTSCFIPKNPVIANEGDAYPVAALPLGTLIHNVQLHPSRPVTLVHSAGSYAKIMRHADRKVVVLLPNKQEIILEKQCMVTVGRVGNIEHSSVKIGSAQRNRELGNRPRSGLKQRKTGRFGRKIKPPKKMKVMIDIREYEKPKPIRCTIPKFMK